MSQEAEQQESTVQEKGPGYIPRRVTDTSEGGLETLIVNGLIRNGWQSGDSQSYDRGYCVDLVHLSNFLKATQPKVAEELQLDSENPVRRQFLARLNNELAARGVIEVLRHGIHHGKATGQ